MWHVFVSLFTIFWSFLQILFDLTLFLVRQSPCELILLLEHESYWFETYSLLLYSLNWPSFSYNIVTLCTSFFYFLFNSLLNICCLETSFGVCCHYTFGSIPLLSTIWHLARYLYSKNSKWLRFTNQMMSHQCRGTH